MTTTTEAPAATRTEVVPFRAGDGMELNLHHVTSDQPVTRGPVLLVHGAGVRADIFRTADQETIVDALLAAGWDVWLENWRASIDLPRNRWNLDQAAVHDHPAAVAEVLERTGADTLKAVIHCQGSSSFALAAVAGLVPQVDTIVSNAMSLHPVVPRLSALKLSRVVPLVALAMDYVDPHWGTVAPAGFLERRMVDLVRLSHRECRSGSCRMVSFVYGAGHPALWSHENLDAGSHRWLNEEFGPVPLTFFAQMSRSVRAGRLVPTGSVPGLPADPVGGAPRTDARFALIAGRDNLCFLPESQERTFDHLERYAPGRHSVHVVEGYGHLDVFMGRYAARDTFPLILEELDR
ncbi:alpha/beta fold hydrolase [Nocardioides sp.]|uniref:alpha/beta fold hydrolase n=1 Tax=Nocardioides sp. TaxID=35761 RepID=UPI003784CB98